MTTETENETTAIAYDCPNCQSTIEVAGDFVGEMVDCPHCQIPFEATPPSATPHLDDPATDQDESSPEVDYSINMPTDDEMIVDIRHPAMFRQHPLSFSGLSLLTVGFIALSVYAFMKDSQILGISLLIPAIISLLYFAYWYIYVLATVVKVSNKRTTLRTGIIARNTTEVQHDDIRNLQIDQNWWQRIFNVGDLALSSSGQDDLEIHVEGIPRPSDLADLVRKMQ